MIKFSKKLVLGVAVVGLVAAASGYAQASSKDLRDHDFVSYNTDGMQRYENMNLNRYINYEEREACQNYRTAPSPFHRSSCNLSRGERMDYTLYFDTGSSAIRGGEYGTINKITRAIEKYNPREVVIVGHTDTQGSVEYNQALSMKRSQMVASALQNKGISSTIIDGDAEGEYDLAVPTGDGVANQMNRRVTVLLVK